MRPNMPARLMKIGQIPEKPTPAPGQLHHGEQVDRDEPLELLPRLVVEPARELEARVVDEDVELADRLFRVANQGLETRRVGQVCRHRLDRDSMRPQLLDQTVHRCRGQVAEREVDTFGRQGPGDVVAQPASGAHEQGVRPPTLHGWLQPIRKRRAAPEETALQGAIQSASRLGPTGRDVAPVPQLAGARGGFRYAAHTLYALRTALTRRAERAAA
jgi:hypothetical protein